MAKWDNKKTYGVSIDNKCRVEVFPEYRLGMVSEILTIKKDYDPSLNHPLRQFNINLPKSYKEYGYSMLFPIGCTLHIRGGATIYYDVNSPQIKEIFEYLCIFVNVDDKRLELRYQINRSYLDSMTSDKVTIDVQIAYMWL